MIKVSSLSRSLLLVLALAALMALGGNAALAKQKTEASKPPSSEEPPVVQMSLEPKATEVLKAASSKLAAARTMSFTAVVSYENPSLLGPPLVYTTKSEVTLQRPDKLRVITPGDGPASEFYYEGTKMTAFAPAENLIATAEAPPTIEEMLTTAFEQAAIYFPFGPMLVADPYKNISDGLILAFYVGQSNVVGGTTTDIVAYANDNVFLQVWVGTEDKLPRMLRGVYRADPAHLRHQLEFSDWQIDPVVPADTFTAKNVGSAQPISFANPDAGLSPYPGPPAKHQPAPNGPSK